jgi:hypothetical protein
LIVDQLRVDCDLSDTEYSTARSHHRLLGSFWTRATFVNCTLQIAFRAIDVWDTIMRMRVVIHLAGCRLGSSFGGTFASLALSALRAVNMDRRLTSLTELHQSVHGNRV